MSDQVEACRARALHCFAIAKNAATPEDRREFLGFGEAWDRLANEIERNERLVSLINELATREFEEVEPHSSRRGMRPLRRLTAAILTMSEHSMLDPLAAPADDGEDDRAHSDVRRAVT